MHPMPRVLPRVLLVAPHFPPETVAGAVRLGSLATELALLGHDVVVVAPGESHDLPGIRVHRVSVAPRGKGRFANARHQLALCRALGRGIEAACRDGGEPDVVIVSSPPPIAALAGRAFARRRALPLIVDVRDIWPDVLVEANALAAGSAAAWLLRVVEKQLLSSAARVSVVTASKRERLAARCAAPVALVPNGVDAAWCEGGEPYAGGDSRDFEVLHAGNVGLAQDVGLLARALSELPPAASRSVRATIIGAGEDLDAVRVLARGLEDRVALLPPEPRLAIRDRLARCGCAFVSLRTRKLVDAVPSKMLEAMGRGVPVIAAVAGEAASLLGESRGGLVTPPGDIDALLDALKRMTDLSPVERREMGQRGRAFVLAGHRREDAAAKMSRLIVEACSPAAQPGAARAPA